MKVLVKICLLSVTLAIASYAYAQTDAAPKPASTMNCPMMGDMNAMQKNMGDMMTDMNGMMSSTADPAMKARMQKMHDQMGVMMSNMRKMNGGMMGGGMMQGGQNMGSTPPATPDDHATHHPNP